MAESNKAQPQPSETPPPPTGAGPDVGTVPAPPAGQVALSDMSAAEASEHIASAPLTELSRLEQQEQGGQNRTTVLQALNRRRKTLQEPPSGGDASLYSVDDMAGYASAKYGSPALATGAFAAAGVESIAGLEAAQKLVDEFAKREV